jgi:LPS-assembly protein
VCLLAAGAAGAQAPSIPDDQQQSTLLEQLTSSQGKIDCPTPNHCIFIGQVEMVMPGGKLKFFAEQIEIVQDKNQLIASGNVVFQNPEGQIAADSVEFDIKSNTGTFHVASGLMPLGAAADPSQFGNQQADVYFWGEKIEKLGDQKYRITRGGFTTCVQPTPRWEVVTGSVTLNLNDHALATHSVLRVKGVPVLYMPVVYYPLEEDERSTGFLLPTYGTSTLRGQALSNAFFWAIGRSHDATFFHDWFTRTGQGAGVEYRYVAAAQSSGDFRLYRLDQNEVTFEDDGQTSTLPATKSLELRGNMNHQVSRGVRARARLDYFSDVVTQQLYFQDVYQATRNNRVMEGGLSAAYGPTATTLLYSRSEYLTDAQNSTLYGTTPLVSSNVAPQRLFGTPIYGSMNAEYVYLPSRSRVDDEIVRDDSHSRIDVAPSIRAPLSRLSFLSVNTSASYRATRFSRRADQAGGTLDVPYLRQYSALEADVVGPVFTRIWDRPDSAFAERLKHLIEPAFRVNVTSQIEDYKSTPIATDQSQFVVGGATEVTYSLTNRFFARSKAAPGQRQGQTREFITVGLQQTAYSNPESIQYDSEYQSTYAHARPLNLSPVALTARFSPSNAVDGNLRVEYDVSGLGLALLSAGGGVNGSRASVNMNYSKRSVDDSDFLSASTSLRWLDGRANGTYSLSWDIGRAYVVSQSIVGSYLAQCCGLQLEFQKFNYPEVPGIPISSDTRFNFGFILAGLGTFSNFFGAFGGQR